MDAVSAHEKMMTDRLNECCPLISRAEAKARGLKRYFTGVPCKHGHVCERLLLGGSCIQCFRERDRRERAENPKRRNRERINHARYRAEHRDRLRELKREWDRRQDKEVLRQKKRQWRAENPETARASDQRKNAIRRAQIKHLDELGFFLPGDTRDEKRLMLTDLKRLGVIKQEEWK